MCVSILMELQYFVEDLSFHIFLNKAYDWSNLRYSLLFISNKPVWLWSNRFVYYVSKVVHELPSCILHDLIKTLYLNLNACHELQTGRAKNCLTGLLPNCCVQADLVGWCTKGFKICWKCKLFAVRDGCCYKHCVLINCIRHIFSLIFLESLFWVNSFLANLTKEQLNLFSVQCHELYLKEAPVKRTPMCSFSSVMFLAYFLLSFDIE